MLFENRTDAGRRLADALQVYADRPDAVVVGLPRGGVVVAAEVARRLHRPLDIVVPRKIGHELQPEYAIGAVTESGRVIWNESEGALADPDYLQRAIAAEVAEATRRLRTYRTGLPPRDFGAKTVILVDDGVATGLTMLAGIKTARSLGARRIVVAVPHGAHDSLALIRPEVDELAVLSVPHPYGAVGQFYQQFDQVDDRAVIWLLQHQPWAAGQEQVD